jgi:ABC-type multidrug transport system fused ATPase/permease subunit
MDAPRQKRRRAEAGTAARLVKRLVRQAQRYLGAIGWLAHWLWSRYPRRVVFIVTGSTVGLFAIGSGVAVVVAFINALESSSSAGGAFAVVARPLLGSLSATATSAGLLLLLGSTLLFLARRQSVSVAARAQVDLALEISDTYGAGPPHPAAWLGEGKLNGAITKLMTTDTRNCAMAIRRALDAPYQVGLVIAGFVVLAVIEFNAALLTVAIVLIVGPVYYVVNVAAVQAARRFELTMGSAREGGLDMVRTRAGSPQRRPDMPHATRPVSLLVAAADAFRDRFVAVARSEYVSNTIMTIAFAVLLIYLGTRALDGSLALGRAAAFVVVLRLGLNGLRGSFNAVATVSRHYPSVQRVTSYLRQGVGPSDKQVQPPVEVRTTRATLIESDATPTSVNPGEPLIVVAPVPPTRYSARLFASAFARRPTEPSLATVTASLIVVRPFSRPRTPVSVREALEYPPDADDAPIHAALGTDGAAFDLDTPLEPTDWKVLRMAALQRAAVSRAASVTGTIVVVDHRAVSKVNNDYLRQMLKTKCVLIWYPKMPPECSDEPSMVVAPDGVVVALGRCAWVHANDARISARVARRTESLLERDDSEASADE